MYEIEFSVGNNDGASWEKFLPWPQDVVNVSLIEVFVWPWLIWVEKKVIILLSNTGLVALPFVVVVSARWTMG
jgi:hypothetical protein